MATADAEQPSQLTKWDPGLTERFFAVTRPLLKRYFRSEVRGLENIPSAGGVLLVSGVGNLIVQKTPIVIHAIGQFLIKLSGQ